MYNKKSLQKESRLRPPYLCEKETALKCDVLLDSQTLLCIS